MNGFESVVNDCLSGTKIIFRLPRREAVDLITELRGIYGPSGPYMNVYHNSVTYAAFGRDMPFAYELLKNINRYEVKCDEERCIDVSLRRA